MALEKDLSPYPSTVLISAVAVALPNVLASLGASGTPNLLNSSITMVPPPRKSSINWFLFSLACFKTCDMPRFLYLESICGVEIVRCPHVGLGRKGMHLEHALVISTKAELLF